LDRRLAAIFAVDVVGYSRLMEADEAGTLAALKSLRKNLIAPEFAEHHGRIVKLMGDGALGEFASVVDAIECAVEIQQGMIEQNVKVPECERIESRPVSKRLPILELFAFRRTSSTRSRTRLTWVSRTWASKRSRTLRSRFGLIECCCRSLP
jgi:hypothetical protein